MTANRVSDRDSSIANTGTKTIPVHSQKTGLIRANTAAAKAPVTAATSNIQSEGIAAAIRHKKQAYRSNDTSQKHTRHNAYY